MSYAPTPERLPPNLALANCWNTPKKTCDDKNAQVFCGRCGSGHPRHRGLSQRTRTGPDISSRKTGSRRGTREGVCNGGPNLEETSVDHSRMLGNYTAGPGRIGGAMPLCRRDVDGRGLYARPVRESVSRSRRACLRLCDDFAARGVHWDGASECARLREVVRQAVHGTWESNSQVRFVGWGVCAGTGVTGCQGVTSDGVQGVRIRVRAGRGAACPGTSIDGVADGMNFELAGRSDDQIRRTAVHEFGHALGFLHEQDRKDTPEWCQEEQGQTGCSSVGVWDASSIMNYCNPNYFSTPAYLSAVDIATVRQVYDTGTIAACSAGLQKCESVCVNQAVDVRHCGACGTACAEGSACIGGVCQSCACAPNSCGNTPCGNACACGINQICNGTACVNVPPPCPLGSRVCGDQCVNIQSSPRHCGECNNACGDAEKCIRGKCIEVGGCHPPTPYRCPDGNCARNRSDCPR